MLVIKSAPMRADPAILAVSPSSAPLRVNAASLPATARLRVLLVEDDDADIYLIRRALGQISRVGDVRVARDGGEALDLIESWPAGPDLAIVDLKMPKKDGFALLREFGARRSLAFPTIVLTSSRAGADAYRAKKRGAAAFLTKPNSVEKLKAALSAVLENL